MLVLTNDAEILVRTSAPMEKRIALKNVTDLRDVVNPRLITEHPLRHDEWLDQTRVKASAPVRQNVQDLRLLLQNGPVKPCQLLVKNAWTQI